MNILIISLQNQLVIENIPKFSSFKESSSETTNIKEKQNSEQMSINEEVESKDQEIHLHQTPANIQEDQFNQNTTSISGNDFAYEIDPNSSNQVQNSYSQNRTNYSLQSSTAM